MQTVENPHFSELIEHNSKLLAVFSPKGHAIVSVSDVIYLVLDYVSRFCLRSSFISCFCRRILKFLLYIMNHKNKT